MPTHKSSYACIVCGELHILPPGRFPLCYYALKCPHCFRIYCHDRTCVCPSLFCCRCCETFAYCKTHMPLAHQGVQDPQREDYWCQRCAFQCMGCQIYQMKKDRVSCPICSAPWCQRCATWWFTCSPDCFLHWPKSWRKRLPYLPPIPGLPVECTHLVLQYASEAYASHFYI